MKKPFLLTMCFLSILIGCGNNNDDDDDEVQREEEVNQETQGFYEAQLVPLNSGPSGSTTGQFQIRVLGDEVRVRGEVDDSSRTFHRQFIHTGENCPGPAADINLDGTLDFNESLRITGQALIPLDRNLSTQRSGYTFPTGTDYNYSETTSLVRMLADLHSEDPDPNDFLTKLLPDENLNLAGRTIVVYGIPGNSQLPIACGAIVRSVEPLPDDEENPPRTVPLPPRVPWDDNFSIRLSLELLISGEKCEGGERTHDNWPCIRNQWLVTVDNINTCTPAGACTEVGVLPFVAELILVREISTNQRAYYNIRPVSPVDGETRDIARDHWVRFTRGGAPIVLRKPQR